MSARLEVRVPIRWRWPEANPWAKNTSLRRGESIEVKSLDGLPRKASSELSGVRTKTDTGRRGEYPKALERTLLKELGKLTP